MLVAKVLPKTINHPGKNKFLTEDGFNALDKQKIQSVPSLCEGHEGRTVWYTKMGYIVQVKFHSRQSVYTITPCTYSPTFGIDRYDSWYIQDAEEYILEKTLGRKSDRLILFHGKDSLNVQDYLKAHGVALPSQYYSKKIKFIQLIKEFVNSIFKK